MKSVLGLIIVIALCAHPPVFAQNTPEALATLAGLEGVGIQVIPTPAEIADKGISATVLAVEVERVLKEGGVPVTYPAPPDTIAAGPYLLLEVVALLDSYIDQVVYSVRLELVQAVLLERDATGQLYGATTWSVGGTGVYGSGWRKAIIQDVVSFAAQFAEAYHQANPPIEE